jgi:deazaflavin-dependent oxidoreductase (nitroreductase family)
MKWGDNMWIKVLMALNVFFYRLTNGRLGSTMSGQSVLLLHTTGRKSGKAYITPTNYFRHGEDYILVASNWGKDKHPAWFLNLRRLKTATIQVKNQTLKVNAREAAGEEYGRLWQFVTSKNPYYLRYQKQTKRKISVVVLTPVK